jgi:hypothetical protein
MAATNRTAARAPQSHSNPSNRSNNRNPGNNSNSLGSSVYNTNKLSGLNSKSKKATQTYSNGVWKARGAAVVPPAVKKQDLAVAKSSHTSNNQWLRKYSNGLGNAASRAAAAKKSQTRGGCCHPGDMSGIVS